MVNGLVAPARASSSRAASWARTGSPIVPIYDFHLASCGAFEQMRSVAMRDEPSMCPRCGAPAPRVKNGMPTLLTQREHAEPADDVAYLARHRVKCFCCD